MHRLLAFALLALLPSSALAEDPLAAAHKHKDRNHTMVVTKVDSTIENLSGGTVQVFSTRREYKCPGGELGVESVCNPCEERVENFADRPHGVWFFDQAFEIGNHDMHEQSVAEAEHFLKYFELEKRTGSNTGNGMSHTFFEYAGKQKAQEAPAVAMRVQLYVNDELTAATTLPAGEKEIAVEARAQRKGESGSLEPFKEAEITFSGTCGVVKNTGKGRALFGLKPGFNRCELKATAMPGNATGSLVMLRETQLDITYEDQAVDEVVLDGSDSVDLSYKAIAKGESVPINPSWKSESGTVELLDGHHIRFKLAKGAARSDVVLTDQETGATDIITVRRKKTAAP